METYLAEEGVLIGAVEIGDFKVCIPPLQLSKEVKVVPHLSAV